LNNFGNIGAFNFALSGPTEYPNCLVEVAFLSNAADEIKIRDERFQKNVARRVSRGIKSWLKSL
jgi:N-acetylmuramoyl-L-alanine amidase